MANLARYGTYTPEAAQTESEELKSGGEFLKLAPGRNVLRVLPPPLGKTSPFLVTYQHTIELPGMSKMLSINCPRMMAKKPCPVCAEADRLRSTGRKADYDLAGDFLARPRIYANVINRGKEASGPVVWAFGKKIHEALIALRQDPQSGGDFTDPTEDGFDLVVTRTGTSKNDTSYTVTASRNSSELGNLDWIDMQSDLSRFGRVPTAEDIRKLLIENKVVRDADEGAAPPRQRRRSAADDAIDTEGTEV